MKAPVAASMRQGNHGPQARSICKKISPQHAQTGKHEYFLKAEIHGRSKPWEFFTDDQLGRLASTAVGGDPNSAAHARGVLRHDCSDVFAVGGKDHRDRYGLVSRSNISYG